MKTRAGPRAFWQPIFDGRLRLFLILLLSAILFPLQLRAQAPANLVNLYDWTNVTVVGSGDDPNNYVFIRSSTSADFEGGFTYESGNFVPVQPAIAGTLNTVPGITYEISFTVQDDTTLGPNTAQFYFDNTDTQIDLPPHQPQDPAIPVNIDFTAFGTSATTTMSFQFGLDPSDDEDSLYDLSVIEAAPEARSGKLFILFACTLLCARNRRRLCVK